MASRLETIYLNDFSGGLVTNRGTSDLELNQSPDIDNLTLMTKGFKKRKGDTAFNGTAMNSGANVQALGYYRPKSRTKYIVSIAGAKIFKSDDLDGTMDDITGAATAPTAGVDNTWTHMILNDLSIMAGGARDVPLKWSGAGNAADLGGTPPQGSFGFVMRNRAFIGDTAANPSQIDWSILSDPEDWSGAGSGSQTVEKDDGDKLVAGIPLNNNVALLFKEFSIHQLIVQSAPFPVKPLVKGLGTVGKHSAVSGNDGLVYFITNEPRMKATNGYTIFDFPDSIDDIWDGLNGSKLFKIQGMYYPSLRQIVWLCPNGSSATNNLAIIWDLDRKCFLRNTTGFDCNVVALADGNRFFGGHTDGVIYEKDKDSTFIDNSETNTQIDAYWTTAWMNIQNDSSVKQVRYFDLNFKTQTAGVIKTDLGYDYITGSNTKELNAEQTGGKWDVDTWDESFIWGGQSDVIRRSFTFGRGNNFQLKIQNDNQNEQMHINSATLTAKQQGVKVIGNV